MGSSAGLWRCHCGPRSFLELEERVDRCETRPRRLPPSRATDDGAEGGAFSDLTVSDAACVSTRSLSGSFKGHVFGRQATSGRSVVPSGSVIASHERPLAAALHEHVSGPGMNRVYSRSLAVRIVVIIIIIIMLD